MQEKSFYFLVEISLICENVMSVMSEGLTSAASESTMRLISGSVTATRELSAIKGCDLSTRATYLRVYTGIYGTANTSTLIYQALVGMGKTQLVSRSTVLCRHLKQVLYPLS